MHGVKPKKSLGQHFLRDENIARKIVVSIPEDAVNILEIGPGEGVLSKYLFSNEDRNTFCIDTDKEAVDYLKDAYPNSADRVIHEDFLRYDISRLFENEFTLAGNLPYNISSQIFFKALEYRRSVSNMIFMIQKEVAERIASPPGQQEIWNIECSLTGFLQH